MNPLLTTSQTNKMNPYQHPKAVQDSLILPQQPKRHRNLWNLPDEDPSVNPQSPNSTLIPHICKLSVIVLNCQSIVSKKADLNCLIETTNPDIIIASETWLIPSINSSEFLPQNYIAYRKDREDGYGGVLLAHKITLTSHQLHIDSLCELVACKFDQIDNPLVIIFYYVLFIGRQVLTSSI